MPTEPHAGDRRRAALGALALSSLLLALAAPEAPARDAYVANAFSDSLSVIDIESGATVGEPIAVGDGPGGVAITPDGRHVYVANHGSDNVSVIDAASGVTAGEPIPVGDGPRGVAVAPGGNRVYVTNVLSDSVSAIDIESGATLGEPIPVGDNPLGIAIAPDGKRVYVANYLSGSVSVIDAGSGATVGEPIPVGDNPLGIQITPDGARAYVANEFSNTVSIIDTSAGGAIDAIPVDSGPTGIAIAPDGRRAYVGSWGTDAVSVIDTESGDLVGEPIVAGSNPFGIAFAPDGGRAFVTNFASADVSVIDTVSGDVVGEPIAVGDSPLGIAIVPNQPPAASLAAPATGTAGQQIRFDASASHDPDGQIARYDWDFGDGHVELDAGPNPTHAYGAPGTYPVTVTLTDSERCSTSLVFTGLTASCNGSSSASATRMLEVGLLPGSPPGPPPPDEPPAESPSNAFRIGKLRRDKRRGIAKLNVRVPGPGALRLHGRRVRTSKRTVGRAGVFTLAVRPNRKAAKALRRRGRLDVRARIAFRPDGGVARTVARDLTLVRIRAR